MDVDALADIFADLCLAPTKPSKQREQGLDSLLHSCPELCTELGLQGLASLATASRGLMSACHSIVCLGPASWIASALDTLKDAQRWRAAVWVLHAAPAAAVDGADHLAHAPAVPTSIAKHFISAGTGVTYAQLLAASHNLVAGVEVWVQVQQQLGIQSDIPAVAEAICCSSIRSIYVYWAELHKGAPASTATAAGLLQLAMNSSSNAAAEAAAHHIPAKLEPEVARKLLTTAALRQHVSAVQHMAGLAVMQQHADPAALQAMLQELIAPSSVQSADSVWGHCHLPKGLPAAQQQHSLLQRTLCIHAICAMPAAARLGSDAVAQLLLTAVRNRAQIICIGRLRRLPAVHQFSSDQVVQLLEEAIELNWASCMEQLCKLPAAHQLSADMLVQLLQTAIEKDSRGCAQMLCGLPGAQEVSSSMLVQLLRAAVKCSSGCFCYLYELPAADDISKKHAMQLFLLAFQVKNSSATDCLIDLPAMALSGPQDVLQLMLAAAEHRFGDGLSMLCGLTTADHLNSSDLAEVLVLIAMQQSFAPDCLREPRDLQALPAASQLTSEQIAQILAAAVQLDNHVCMQAMCGWRAAMNLDNSQIMPLLGAALELGHDNCARFLCSKLTMWADVGTAQVMQLLMASVQHGCSGCFKDLCELRASVSKLRAEHLSPLLEAAVKHKDSACLSELLVVAQAKSRSQGLDPVVFVPAIKAAVSLNDAVTVRHLCMLTQAWHLDATHVAALLQAAQQAGSVGCVEQLCQLPAAQQLQMSCKDALELMLAAAESGSKECMLHLCRMPAAKFLTWSQVEGLLQVSVGVGSAGCVELLCQLPAAAGLDMAVVAQLLRTAKQQGGAGFERM